MDWSAEKLSRLPQKGGFRLRGLTMTRLETFTDAAFAFATTLLVISLSGIPDSVDELVLALKGVPAFLASFASIAAIWYAHRLWSRRYGLEDGPAILLSLGLIFIMLVYVYPLKMVFSALFFWISGGWFPTNFALRSATDLPNLFVIYGFGFFGLTGAMWLLYLRALHLRDVLGLNRLERLRTKEEVVSHGVLALTGLASALFAWVLPPHLAIWAGFAYTTLAISMPMIATIYERRVKRAMAASRKKD
jgi:uncharacterized membrane protein